MESGASTGPFQERFWKHGVLFSTKLAGMGRVSLSVAVQAGLGELFSPSFFNSQWSDFSLAKLLTPKCTNPRSPNNLLPLHVRNPSETKTCTLVLLWGDFFAGITVKETELSLFKTYTQPTYYHTTASLPLPRQQE